MRFSKVPVALTIIASLAACGPSEDTASDAPPAGAATAPDPIPALIARLDLERYKATIKGLTQFGDRLHGTDRNRAAIDWIEAQLNSYGCSTERFAYAYSPPEGPAPPPPPSSTAASDPPRAVGGGRPRGTRVPTTPNNDLDAQEDAR